MTKKKAQITSADTEEMFGGDILDRVPGNRAQQPADSAETATAEVKESKPIKVSLYLTPEDVNSLDEIIMQRRLRNGSSPRRTHLIREAIHQWLETQ